MRILISNLGPMYTQWLAEMAVLKGMTLIAWLVQDRLTAIVQTYDY